MTLTERNVHLVSEEKLKLFKKTTDGNGGQAIINGNVNYPSEIEKKIVF